jgi:hypothetical protein
VMWSSLSSEAPDTSSLSPSEPMRAFSCTTPASTHK